MAGHSKWANIKHRKAAQDKKRAKVFTRAIKEITIAARDAGGDVETNPSLRLAVQNAKGANMPKDTIERAIKKGLGGEGASLAEITFEGYASKGIAVFVEATTDNNNRTVASVRSIFNKYAGNLGTNGSLGFLFERKGVFTIKRESINIEDLEEVEMELIDFGLEELSAIEDEVIIQTSFDDYGKMQAALEEKKWLVSNTELQRIPMETTSLSIEDAQTVMKLIDKMEEDDDVNAVYHNLEITEELIKSL
ncbi:MAG: YebC/PmpR family DNA-binding transcriptional regulator [Flavobacteriales bacterium]|nr:YebC/PmpR family DNA-binding transcriptional regulator [Flavobacteriales bacterium]